MLIVQILQTFYSEMETWFSKWQLTQREVMECLHDTSIIMFIPSWIENFKSKVFFMTWFVAVQFLLRVASVSEE